MLPLSRRDHALACAVVESLDDDGYLRTDLEELAPVQRSRARRRGLGNADRAEAGPVARPVRRRRAQRLGVPAAAARLHRRPRRSANSRAASSASTSIGSPSTTSTRSPNRSAARRRRSRRSATASAIFDPRPGWRLGASDVHFVTPDVIVTQGPRQVDRDAESRRDPARQAESDLCVAVPGAPRVAPQRARRAPAGSALDGAQRAAALLDDPARGRGDPEASAALPRVRTDGDEAARPARDRRGARPARIDGLARHQQQVHGDAGRRVRAEVLLLARDDDGQRRRVLGHRDPRRHQGDDRGREPDRAAVRRADRAAARPPGPEGRAAHGHEVPPAAEAGARRAPAQGGRLRCRFPAVLRSRRAGERSVSAATPDVEAAAARADRGDLRAGPALDGGPGSGAANGSTRPGSRTPGGRKTNCAASAGWSSFIRRMSSAAAASWRRASRRDRPTCSTTGCGATTASTAGSSIPACRASRPTAPGPATSAARSTSTSASRPRSSSPNASGSLRVAERRQGAFLSMLSHELRNPLAPIANAASVLRSLEKTNPVLVRLREILERQVDRLERLVENLVDATRSAQGQISLVSEPIAIDSVVRDAVESSAATVDQFGHSLDVQLPTGGSALGQGRSGASGAGAFERHRERRQVHPRDQRHRTAREDARRPDRDQRDRPRPGHDLRVPAACVRAVCATGTRRRRPAARSRHRADAGAPHPATAQRQDRSIQRRHRHGHAGRADAAPHRVGAHRRRRAGDGSWGALPRADHRRRSGRARRVGPADGNVGQRGPACLERRGGPAPKPRRSGRTSCCATSGCGASNDSIG